MNETMASVEPRDSPYFGLDYYDEKFGAWFFGRETEGGKIITNLRAARLTLLHAESGGPSIGLGVRFGRLAVDFARIFFESSSLENPVYLSLRAVL